MRKISIILITLAILGTGVFVYLRNTDTTNSANTKANGGVATAFDKKQRSLDDPASIWIIVNKQRPLNLKTYTPSDLVAPNVPLRLTAKDDEMLMRKEAAGALETMFAAGEREDVKLMISSGYRSYSFQVGLYNRYVSQQGKAVADTQSARPGHSEHQTGLAIDVEPASRKCEVEDCFGETLEGKWVAANAYRYGFVIRYQQNKQNLTGYIYEPWHIRYVGKDLATEIHKQGDPTLEQFFGLPAAPDYQ